MRCSVSARLALWSAAALLFASAAAKAEDKWGTVEGQVTWNGGAVPAPAPANVDKDQAVCLKNGPIFKQDYVVNPKNKGVRWAVVWLVDANNPLAPLPINPDLPSQANVKGTKVILDQPCCQFEPHIICLREGQVLVAKNSGTIAHNTKIDSPGDSPSVNPLIPAGTEQTIEGWKASRFPSTVGCSIHGWMTGYIRVFNSPYFAVTDEDGKFKIDKAPAGNYRIFAWQETVGFLNKDFKKGQAIDIKADGVTDVNFEVKPKAAAPAAPAAAPQP
jgi:hypothetical protein